MRLIAAALFALFCVVTALVAHYCANYFVWYLYILGGIGVIALANHIWNMIPRLWTMFTTWIARVWRAILGTLLVALGIVALIYALVCLFGKLPKCEGGCAGGSAAITAPGAGGGKTSTTPSAGMVSSKVMGNVHTVTMEVNGDNWADPYTLTEDEDGANVGLTLIAEAGDRNCYNVRMSQGQFEACPGKSLKIPGKTSFVTAMLNKSGSRARLVITLTKKVDSEPTPVLPEIVDDDLMLATL